MPGYAQYCWLNGEILEFEKARLAVNDVALIRSYAVFDFFRKQAGKPLFIDDYLTRFENSANEMRLNTNLSVTQLKMVILDLLERNNLEESGVRLLLTGGYTDNGYSINEPNFLILEELLTLPDATLFNNGIRLITHNYQREIPTVKTTNYLMGLYLSKKVEDAGAHDILYHKDGMVREITRSNFFIVNRDGELITAKNGVLLGITRMKILELAREKVPVIERDFTLEEVLSAKEVFITGTTKKVMPVSKIDDWQYDAPGEITRILMDDFEQLVKREISLNL